MGTVIRSASLVSEGCLVRDGWLRIDGNRIAARGARGGWRACARAGDEAINASEFAGEDAVLTPGLIDLHGYGGAGGAYDDGAEAIRTVRVGRLSFVEDDILGSHLEGPLLDPGHHGAHGPELLIPPSSVVLERLLAAGVVDGRQTICQVAIAPELPDAMKAIARLARAGAVAAVGHTNADAATTRYAFDAGASLLTHAYNAMPAASPTRIA